MYKWRRSFQIRIKGHDRSERNQLQFAYPPHHILSRSLFTMVRSKKTIIPINLLATEDPAGNNLICLICKRTFLGKRPSNVRRHYTSAHRVQLEEFIKIKEHLERQLVKQYLDDLFAAHGVLKTPPRAESDDRVPSTVGVMFILGGIKDDETLRDE